MAVAMGGRETLRMSRQESDSADDERLPPAVTVLNDAGRSCFVLTVEHASNFIPRRYGNLGLPDVELTRHIAWDIGVAPLARGLAARLDAPAFLSGYSRLLIDCNRPMGVSSSIPLMSEVTEIPGNRDLAATERAYRAEHYFWPYQKAITRHLDRRQQAGRSTVIFAVHSFTPVFKGVVRPWHAGVLFRKSEAYGEALVEALDRDGLVIGANEPYQISDEGDYVVPVHGEGRGLDVVLIEVRQDLIADARGVAEWTDRLADGLLEVERQLYAA